MEFTFETERKTEWGDRLFVVGNISCFGNWNPKKGLELFTNKKIYPDWKSGICRCNAAMLRKFEYKYVIVKKNGGVYWESGNNRSLINRLKISHCEFDKTFKYRIAKEIEFLDMNKSYSTIFSALCNLNSVFIHIKGDMKKQTYATILEKNFLRKRIVLEVTSNYMKINNITMKYMPYYIMEFDKEEKNIMLKGPYECV